MVHFLFSTTNPIERNLSPIPKSQSSYGLQQQLNSEGLLRLSPWCDGAPHETKNCISFSSSINEMWCTCTPTQRKSCTDLDFRVVLSIESSTASAPLAGQIPSLEDYVPFIGCARILHCQCFRCVNVCVRTWSVCRPIRRDLAGGKP